MLLAGRVCYDNSTIERLGHTPLQLAPQFVMDFFGTNMIDFYTVLNRLLYFGLYPVKFEHTSKLLFGDGCPKTDFCLIRVHIEFPDT